MTVAAPSRYLLVSGTCLVAHNAILIGANAAGLGLIAALALSFAIVLTLGFVLHSRFTFAAPGDLAAFGRYTLAMASNLPLTAFLLWLLHDVAAWPMVLAAPASTLLLVIFNYFASRWAILRSRTA